MLRHITRASGRSESGDMKQRARGYVKNGAGYHVPATSNTVTARRRDIDYSARNAISRQFQNHCRQLDTIHGFG